MSEARTIHDPFLGKDVEISNRLTDRLRGKYANGPTMENGEPEFGWREFETPPIQHEAAAEIERLRSELDKARQVLRQHHKWHLDAGEIGLPDGDGGWIGIDAASEYGDSLLFEHTTAVLDGLPAEPPEPMPRGGMNMWWWGVAVVERRKRKAAERTLTANKQT